MASILVLGAGVAGHTAAAFLQKWLGSDGEVTVVSPKPDYNWLPSNIWVGVGRMSPDKVLIPLAPIYSAHGIRFKQARALSIHPEGSVTDAIPHVEIESTLAASAGARELLHYDFLINATGPKLNYAATEGLGPDKYSYSVCTASHAAETAVAFLENVERMKRGERRRFVVGTGHGTCTCEGAAFEYIVNLEFELRRHGVRDKADVIYLSNEYELGDFGMGGAHIRRNGYITPTNIFTESLFAERGIEWIIRSHVQKLEPGRLYYENLDGEEKDLAFDMAMLLPPFSGVGLKAYNQNGEDITSGMFTPNGFMKVDAVYEPKPYENWLASDWPRTYQSPASSRIFAAGIAFAPPHAISRPHISKRGTPIFAAPPRTGMPSATIGKTVAHTVVDMIRGTGKPMHSASMAELGAACVASAGADIFHGTAATMTVFPIVPDYERFPEYGRDLDYTIGEIGLAGHWVKLLLHYLFMYKARLRPGWAWIPE
ncbi:MAG: NAD(P)/FAD-dependent oxidoreductase [Acidobacteria bacterium]|nr:NAD(P)/FAD-dependent oxidoreductase [Acidobacteriota bacterium]MBW4044596.1 NAD(P)/FAD-dependent oxidoreductase [Acidobacteriota bacterium]